MSATSVATLAFTPMTKLRSILQKPWPWLGMAAVVLAVYTSVMIDIEVIPTDERPMGTVADIEALAERDDVNVMFILIDTLRADRMSAWGYHRDTTPFMERLADDGVRFSQHIAQSSWTKCSMASLWTGLYPSRTGVTRFDDVLSDEAVMPAELMQEAGFRTVGLFRNGWVESYFGFGQGFDVYTRPVGQRPDESVRRENPTISDASTDAGAVSAAEEFLRAYGDERWFLYLHLMDVHEYLYDEDSALFGTAFSDVYDNSIRRMDRVVERLYEVLMRRGLLENTVIVIASDHGEAFSERGYEGHARFVYKETTHVPLLMSFPFRLKGGTVVEDVTRNIDLWPTMLDLLGLPAMKVTDGTSQRDALIAAVSGESANDGANDGGWAHLDRTWGQRGMDPKPTVSRVDDQYRYVRLTRQDGSYTDELFDRRDDPAELQDVGEAQAQVLERMRTEADEYLGGEVPWSEEVPALELDEMQLNQLRALGYQVP